MRYPSDIIPVCVDCANNDQEICKRCAIAYCKHFASTIDFHYCANCLDDFSVVETIETKTTEYTNEHGVVTSRKRQMAKNLKLTGTDWLFAQYAIENLTDEELVETIEYHRNIASLMLMERETRKTEEYKKLAGIKVRVITKEPKGDGKDKAPKTPKAKKEPDQNAIFAALQTLLSANMTPEQIMALGGKKK